MAKLFANKPLIQLVCAPGEDATLRRWSKCKHLPGNEHTLAVYAAAANPPGVPEYALRSTAAVRLLFAVGQPAPKNADRHDAARDSRSRKRSAGSAGNPSVRPLHSPFTTSKFEYAKRAIDLKSANHGDASQRENSF